MKSCLSRLQQKYLHNWKIGQENEYHDLVSLANDELFSFESTNIYAASS